MKLSTISVSAKVNRRSWFASFSRCRGLSVRVLFLEKLYSSAYAGMKLKGITIHVDHHWPVSDFEIKRHTKVNNRSACKIQLGKESEQVSSSSYSSHSPRRSFMCCSILKIFWKEFFGDVDLDVWNLITSLASARDAAGWIWKVSLSVIFSAVTPKVNVTDSEMMNQGARGRKKKWKQTETSKSFSS